MEYLKWSLAFEMDDGKKEGREKNKNKEDKQFVSLLLSESKGGHDSGLFKLDKSGKCKGGNPFAEEEGGEGKYLSGYYSFHSYMLRRKQFDEFSCLQHQQDFVQKNAAINGQSHLSFWNDPAYWERRFLRYKLSLHLGLCIFWNRVYRPSMAVTFAPHSLSLASSRPSLRTPTLTTLPIVRFSPPESCLGYQTISPLLPRRSFRPRIKITDSESSAIGGEEDNADQPSVKTLIQVYKEAILDGDEKAISGTEGILCGMEADKNELLQKVTTLSTDITSGKNKFLRLKADFENYRKRSENDRLTLTSDVRGEVIESLLALVDSFERARLQLKPETEKEKKIDTSYQGIYKQFVEVMRSLGVAVVETVGKPFDPSFHEAIAREESQVFKEGVVVEEIRRGFLLGERLLRPAKVKVSTGPGPGKAPSTTDKTIQQPGQ
ncbi:uncharacterized protein [Aristolochia californica]|uniref:uncharacterized protein n=1 Tax=Aristolochia californica TaxID=171875 RepID=UPI0035E3A9E0